MFLKFSSDYNVIKMNASGHLLDISGAVIYDFSTVTFATNSKNPEIHIREDYSIIQSNVSYVDSPSVKFDLRVEPSIPFKVLRYECGFDSPFKGGIVFDDDLRFAGLSYYGEKNNDKNYVYAIPVSEIYNYLYV